MEKKATERMCFNKQSKVFPPEQLPVVVESYGHLSFSGSRIAFHVLFGGIFFCFDIVMAILLTLEGFLDVFMQILLEIFGQG